MRLRRNSPRAPDRLQCGATRQCCEAAAAGRHASRLAWQAPCSCAQHECARNVAALVHPSHEAEEAPLGVPDNRRVMALHALRRGARESLVALALTLSVAACSSSPSIDVSWHQAEGYRWRALAVPARGHAGFTQLDGARTGLAHRNDVDDEHAMANRNLLLGAGVALGDVDGDGRPDVFLASVERPAALYHNDGDFRFTDVTASSGIDASTLATTGASFADVDADGDLDLMAGTLGGPLVLWLNDGKGHFRDATQGSGLEGGYAATTLTLADVDGNGSLDLYVATYKKRNALDAFPPQARAFDQTVQKVGDSYRVVDAWQSEFRIDVRPDLGGIVRSQRAEPDLLFLNDGKGHFTRVSTAGPRFQSASGAPLDHEPDYFTLAARFYDVNGDGAPTCTPATTSRILTNSGSTTASATSAFHRRARCAKRATPACRSISAT